MRKRWLIFFLLPVAFLHAEDWLKWRGPRSNGVSRETQWNPQALKSDDCILWKTDVGMGHSAVAVQGQRLYTMGNVELSDNQFEDWILCLSTETGEEIWRYSYSCPEGEDPGPLSTPVVEDNRIYALSREGHLHCLDVESGHVIWKRELGTDSEFPGKRVFGSSPLIAGNALILNINRHGAAFDKKTGRTLWKSPDGEGYFGSPVPFQFQGETFVALADNRDLNGVNPQTGELMWTLPWGQIPDPIALKDRLLAFRDKTALFELTGSQPRKIWQTSEGGTQFQSFVVIGDCIYGFGGGGRRHQDFYCLSLKDGSQQWLEKLPQWGSLIGTENGKLIIITGDGKLMIAQASPGKFDVISEKQVIHNKPHDRSRGYRRECSCWTNPVLAHGRVYVRNSWGRLACVDLRNRD